MKIRKLILVVSLVFMFVFIIFIINDYDFTLTDRFIGTYISDERPRTSIAVAPLDNNSFYYSDYDNNVFVKGIFEECDEGTYLFLSNAMGSKSIIHDGKVIKIEVDGCQLIYKKISETPILDGNSEIYSN